jgi:hypothetical protein
MKNVPHFPFAIWENKHPHIIKRADQAASRLILSLLIGIVACFGSPLLAQNTTDTLPVRISTVDRAGIIDPTQARIKTAANDFAASLVPIFNGSIELEVYDEIFYPKNLYQDPNFFANQVSDRFRNIPPIALQAPELRSGNTILGQAKVYVMREYSAEGTKMQVRFLVRLPRISFFSEAEQAKIEAELVKLGEAAASGKVGGTAVADGIDAMRLRVENLLNVTAFDDFGNSIRYVSCVNETAEYYILPSGIVARHTNPGTFIPYYFDPAGAASNKNSKGSLFGFNYNGEKYVAIFFEGSSYFTGFVKDTIIKQLKKTLNKETIPFKDIKAHLYTGFVQMPPGKYSLSIPIQMTGTGIVQRYEFEYTNPLPEDGINGVLKSSIIPPRIYARCDFCEEFKNSPGKKYYQDAVRNVPENHYEELQRICDKAKAFNAAAGKVANTTIDLAYWDNFMREIYGQTLDPFETNNQTHAEYVAGLYAFANWYTNEVKTKLNSFDDQTIMAFSLLWLPDAAIKHLDCATIKKIVKVLLSEKLKGKLLYKSTDSRAAFQRLASLVDDVNCLLDAYVNGENTEQNYNALVLVALPPEKIEAFDCPTVERILGKLLTTNSKDSSLLKSSVKRQAFLKLMNNIGSNLSTCFVDKLGIFGSSCTTGVELFEAFKGNNDFFANFVSGFIVHYYKALASWPTEKIKDIYKRKAFHVGYMGWMCPISPYVRFKALTISGCTLSGQYVQPNGYKIVDGYEKEDFRVECDKPLETPFSTGLFDLVTFVPTFDIPELGWKAGEYYVAPAIMILYFEGKQSNENNAALLKIGFTGLNVAFLISTLGGGSILEMGTIPAVARVLAVFATTSDILIRTSERSIIDLFGGNKELAREFIHTFHTINAIFLLPEIFVTISPLAEAGVIKLRGLLSKAPKKELNIFKRLDANIEEIELALNIKTAPVRNGFRALSVDDVQNYLIRQYIHVVKLFKTETAASKYAAEIAEALVKAGKGDQVAEYVTKDFLKLYAQAGEGSDAIRKYLLSLFEINWKNPSQLSEFLSILQRNPNLIAQYARLSNGVIDLKVIYGGDDLSRLVIEARRNSTNPTHPGNVMAVEYTDLNGVIQRRAFSTPENFEGPIRPHSEQVFIAFIRGEGIPPQNVSRIYSELEPCLLKDHMCKNLLNEFPNAKRSYSFDYPGTDFDAAAAIVRKFNVANRQEILNSIFKP